MQEIGEALKEARESIGISIEEAANDLKLKPSQIESIEAGDKDAFKDIFYLKYFIRDYSKYLGLNYEDMIDEFNEYLFDYTSKLSLDDIKSAKKKSDNEEKREERKVVSPYTYERKEKPKTFIIVVCILIALTILSGSYLIFSNMNKGNNSEPSKGNVIE